MTDPVCVHDVDILTPCETCRAEADRISSDWCSTHDLAELLPKFQLRLTEPDEEPLED